MKKFVCIALAACFVVALVSFSSSADNVTQDIPLTSFSWWAVHNNDWLVFNLGADGVFSLGPISSLESPEPYFSVIYCHVTNIPALPSVDGKSVFLSVSLDITVSLDGSLRFAYSNGGNVLSAAAFRSCKLSAGDLGVFDPVAFTLLDHTGVVVDVNSESFWRSFASDGGLLQVNAIFDITSLIPYDIQSFDFLFPASNSQSYLCLWASSSDYSYQLRVDSCTMHYTYKPFNDVVQDDLTDIKGQLGTLNSTMNTIDQDVNRVNQSVTDLKDTIEDFQQDLTSSDSSISSDISDKQDIIDSIQDAMQNDNALLDDNLNDMITGFPGAQDPFHNAPSPDGFFAVDFIQQLWSFIKAQTVFFDFIFLGLCFCLATFILRR